MAGGCCWLYCSPRSAFGRSLSVERCTSGVLEVKGVYVHWVDWLGWALWWFEGVAGDVVKRVSELAGLELGLGQVEAVQLQLSTTLWPRLDDHSFLLGLWFRLRIECNWHLHIGLLSGQSSSNDASECKHRPASDVFVIARLHAFRVWLQHIEELIGVASLSETYNVGLRLCVYLICRLGELPNYQPRRTLDLSSHQ